MLQAVPGGLNRLVAVLHGLAVGSGSCKSVGERRDSALDQGVFEREEVLLALAIFLPPWIVEKCPCIQKLKKLPAGGRFDWAISFGVVDVDVVDPAAVDVELLAEKLHAHGRALDVPAGKTRSPRGIPLHLAPGAGRGKTSTRRNPSHCGFSGFSRPEPPLAAHRGFGSKGLRIPEILAGAPK